MPGHQEKEGENSVPGVGVGAKEQIDGEHKFSFNQKRKILFLTKSKSGSRVFNFRRGEKLLKGLKGGGEGRGDAVST